MKSYFEIFGSYKNAARAPKVSPQSVQRSKSGGEACSNDSKSRSFVRQSVFNRKRLNSKERTTYDRKVRIGAQLANGNVFYLGQCVLQTMYTVKMLSDGWRDSEKLWSLGSFMDKVTAPCMLKSHDCRSISVETMSFDRLTEPLLRGRGTTKGTRISASRA